MKWVFFLRYFLISYFLKGVLENAPLMQPVRLMHPL
jgi:hypothetical protein